MLTKNGKAVLKYMSGNGYGISWTLKSTAGSDVANSVSTAAQRGNFFGALSMMVGSGTTAPTKDDYNLETVESGLTVVSSSSTISNAPSYTQDYILNYSRTYKNSTASPITISEVALYISYNSNNFIITRDVFTPVTLQPDEVYTLSVTIG